MGKVSGGPKLRSLRDRREVRGKKQGLLWNETLETYKRVGGEKRPDLQSNRKDARVS